MTVKKKFKDLFITKNKIFKDNRGYFKELLRENIIKKKFPFIVMSYSKKNVIRGLHLQTQSSQGKFVTAIKGRVFDIAVDLRKNSKTYGEYFSCILSEKNSNSIYIPPGFAHGFQALDKENYIIYNCTKYRNSKSEVAIKYDDKNLRIKWPLKRKIVSKKDKDAISFLEFKKKMK